MNDKETVGRLIREARHAAGLTVEKVGEIVGTTHGHISQIERGEHIVGWDLLARVADVFGLSLDVLLGREKVLDILLQKSVVVERIITRIEPDQIPAFESLMNLWLSLPAYRRASIQSMAELVFADQGNHAKARPTPRPRKIKQRQEA